AGATAWHALDAVGLGVDALPGSEAVPGEGAGGDAPTLLVHGGAGSVGSAVVQLAVARGARVIATSGASNEEYVRAIGAERVRELAPGGVDAAIDTVGTSEAIDVSVELVADRERIATVAGLEYGAQHGIRLLGHGPGMDPGTEVRAAARKPLLELAGAGDLAVRVAEVFALDEVRAAHELIASGHAPGKVILVP